MRATPLDAARRIYNHFTRGTLKKANDSPKMQEVDLDLLADESKTKVERIQNYGITSVPLPEKDNDSAEVVIAFIGGLRDHPVVIAIDDRRYRLKGLKDGEVALYDDQGQVVHLTRDGLKLETPKKIDITANGGDLTAWSKGHDGIFRNDKQSVSVQGDKTYLGKRGVSHAVVTVDGESKKVFAAIDETESG